MCFLLCLDKSCKWIGPVFIESIDLPNLQSSRNSTSNGARYTQVCDALDSTCISVGPVYPGTGPALGGAKWSKSIVGISFPLYWHTWPPRNCFPSPLFFSNSRSYNVVFVIKYHMCLESKASINHLQEQVNKIYAVIL